MVEPVRGALDFTDAELTVFCYNAVSSKPQPQDYFVGQGMAVISIRVEDAKIVTNTWHHG